MKRFLLLFFLSLPLVLAANESPLTNITYTWSLYANETIGLPWYSVTQRDIEICTQGLTSSYGYDPESNNIVEARLATPIYRDTVTILAKKQTFQKITYYELGWYLQPFEGTYDAEVLLYDDAGRNSTLATGQPSEEAAFEGYKAFPEPCDPDQWTCPSFKPTRAQLRWRTAGGEWQYFTTRFLEANGGEGG